MWNLTVHTGKWHTVNLHCQGKNLPVIKVKVMIALSVMALYFLFLNTMCCTGFGRQDWLELQSGERTLLSCLEWSSASLHHPKCHWILPSTSDLHHRSHAQTWNPSEVWHTCCSTIPDNLIKTHWFKIESFPFSPLCSILPLCTL